MSDQPKAPSEPLLYSVRSAAARLSVGQSTLWAMIAAGKLKTVRLGRSRRIPHSELERIAEGEK